jgi:RimJ/RimL family protein N-acetyltransferase
MIKLELTTDEAMINCVLMDQDVANASFPDDVLKDMQDGTFQIPAGYRYYLIKNNGVICGLVRIGEMTNIAADLHFHIFKRFWGTGVSDAVEAAAGEILKQDSYVTVMSMSPKCCVQVIKAALRVGYEIVGAIPKGIYWRGSMEDLVILSKSIVSGRK